MITVTRCFWTAKVVLIATSLSAAGDSPAVEIDSEMVVVGHSLGGILAKMMVQSGGPRLWQAVCALPIDQVIEPTLLVHGLHICVNHPAVIEEVRRILMEHATPLAEQSSRNRGDRCVPCDGQWTAKQVHDKRGHLFFTSICREGTRSCQTQTKSTRG